MMNSAQELIEDIKAGKMVILIDDEDRENEGDLVLAAEFATPEKINFMAKEARGLICLALSGEKIDALGLPLMVGDQLNHSPNKTAFTVSIEASTGVSTGISAADRSHTILTASKAGATKEDIIMPGHIFPIRAQKGGVLKRAGHTEGSVDLSQLAGLESAAVICEVMNDDGTMARVDDLRGFAKRHNMKIGTIVDLIEYRLQNETLIEEMPIPEERANVGDGFTARVFKSVIDGTEHVALVKGEVSEDSTLVRVHSENAMNDFLTSFFSPSGSLARAASAIKAEGSGVLLYLRTQNQHEDGAKSMDSKDYGIGAQILRQIGLRDIRLLTNSDSRKIGLKGYGLEITETISY
jgi:3,4-dihydroxy 2-butanone 4-phosphate synthase/GTP cyclohydrolase II